MPLTRLILVRHGKAEERAPSGKDFDRALTERGRADAREIGARLAEAGYRPDAAVVSAARRTRETWDELAWAWPGVEARFEPALFHANAAAILDAAERAGAQTVAVVGHNPGAHALAFELVARGRAEPAAARSLVRGFPTSAAAMFRLNDGESLCEAVFMPGDPS